MRRSSLILLLIGAGITAPPPGVWSADAAAVDSAGAPGADSTSATAPEASIVPADSLDWRAWKDITRAIALQPLDGPEDILEKRDIILDRLDNLALADSALGGRLEHLGGRAGALAAQLEALEDIADLQLSGDLPLEQRLQNLRGDLGEMREALARRRDERARLLSEMERLRQLQRQYQSMASKLRQEETRR